MRFHQAIQFLPLEDVRALTLAADQHGYDGVYLSDHLFNPRELESKYTYSTAPDGAPFWEKETEWPDPMCLISSLAAVTEQVTFTTGIYIAPVRDLITVAKSVGTTAVLSDNRVRLGVGVGWCKEEYIQTGQDFHNRGKRLDDMIPALRALWSGGWVEYHGSHYDVPACQMNPSPTAQIPILCGGDSPPALRRAATLCDGWINTGAVFPDEAIEQVARVLDEVKKVGRSEDDFSIYVAVKAFPDMDLFHRLEDAGVTDLLCAPWMLAEVADDDTPETLRAKRLDQVEKYAVEYIEPMRDR